MTRETIKKKLAKVREKIRELQAVESDLVAQERDADYAASTKIIEKHHNTPEQLSFLNSLKEHEIAAILRMRETQAAPCSGKSEEGRTGPEVDAAQPEQGKGEHSL